MCEIFAHSSRMEDRGNFPFHGNVSCGISNWGRYSWLNASTPYSWQAVDLIILSGLAAYSAVSADAYCSGRQAAWPRWFCRCMFVCWFLQIIVNC